MWKPRSVIFSKMFGFFVPTLVGIVFFFVIIGVFGLWFAVGGFFLAEILALAIIRSVPVEGTSR
jgi:hypothetical protein